MQVRRPAPADRAAALRRATSRGGEPNEPLADQLLTELGDDDDAWGGLLEARRQESLVGALWVQVQAGGTSLVQPPQLIAGEDESTAGLLLDVAIHWLSEGRAQLAQALLETDHGPLAQRLLSSGFEHAADLLYLVSLAASFPTEPPKSALEFEPFSDADFDRLCRIVERTYVGTLDCPRLNDVRRTDDVLTGYRAIGTFEPTRWLLVRHNSADVGCLLLADHRATQQFEIVYMGLVAEARGRGWGIELARCAQWLAREAGRKQLVLAVDAANAPAVAAYAAAGFVAWDRRSVLLRVLGDS